MLKITKRLTFFTKMISKTANKHVVAVYNHRMSGGTEKETDYAKQWQGLWSN